MAYREAKLGVGVFLTSLAVLLVRFLVPRPVGLADNGDGARLLCQFGATDIPRPLETYVRFAYGPAQPCGSNYASTQLWLDRLASRLGHALGETATLNVLLVGLLSCVLAAGGIALIVGSLRLSTQRQLIAAAALLLLVADSAFFGYFASVFSEFAAFFGLLITTAGLLLMRRAGWAHHLGAVVTLVGGVIAVNAKLQTVLILPALLVALCFTSKPGGRAVSKWLMPVVVLVGLVASTAVLQSKDDAGSGFREMNMYHAIFHSIVDGKHDTQRDLADLGLPASFAKYANSTWWTPVRATQDPDYPKYESLISRRNVTHYYRTHPVRTAQILQKAGVDLLTARPDYLANFGEHSGLSPRTMEYRVPVISGLTALIAPLGLAALVPWWALLSFLGVRQLRGRAAKRTPRPEFGLVVLFLVASAIGQFFVAALAEGIEGVKHQTIALFCTLLASVFTGLMFLPRKEAAQPGAAEPAAGRSAESSVGAAAIAPAESAASAM